MDVGQGKQNGNGHAAEPEPLQLPSAGGTKPPSGESQAPQGPALPGAPASASAAPPAVEKPASTPPPKRDPKGRLLPGQKLNPKGENGGIPHLNRELVAAAKAFHLGDKSYLQLLLAKSLQDPRYAEMVIPRILASVTAPGPLIDASDKSQHHYTENYVRIGEHLADPGTRDALALLAERLGARGVFSGGDGHVG